MALRILIVEDEDIKFERINAFLNEEESNAWRCIRATDYSSASRLIETERFDLVILDFFIPAFSGGKVDAGNASALLNIIENDGCYCPTHVVGLSQYEQDELPNETDRFGYLQTIRFSYSDEYWKKKLYNICKFLEKVSKSSYAHRHFSFDYDVLIVTAREENEYNPIVGALHWSGGGHNHLQHGAPYKGCVGDIVLPSGQDVRAAVVCVGEVGLSAAASVVASAISLLRPKHVVMLGMCAGLRRTIGSSLVGLGDVIISSECELWDGLRYTDSDDGTVSEPKSPMRFGDENIVTAARGLLEGSERVVKDGLRDHYRTCSHLKGLGTLSSEVTESAEVRIGLNVSGSSLVASNLKQKEIIDRIPRAISLEMEIYAVYRAVFATVGNKPTVIAVKGVTDLADKEKGKALQASASVGSLKIWLKIFDRYLEVTRRIS